MAAQRPPAFQTLKSEFEFETGTKWNMALTDYIQYVRYRVQCEQTSIENVGFGQIKAALDDLTKTLNALSQKVK